MQFLRPLHASSGRYRACLCAGLKFRKYLVGFFRIPAFRGPAEAFFSKFSRLFVANEKISIRLTISGLPGIMLAIADSWIRRLYFRAFHGPTMAPLLCKVKVLPGIHHTHQHIENITSSISRYVLYQIQGLVKVPSWEFESPLRHHFLKPLQ